MVIKVKSSWYCPFWRAESGVYKCNVSSDGDKICEYKQEVSDCPIQKEDCIVVIKSKTNKDRLFKD